MIDDLLGCSLTDKYRLFPLTVATLYPSEVPRKFLALILLLPELALSSAQQVSQLRGLILQLTHNMVLPLQLLIQWLEFLPSILVIILDGSIFTSLLFLAHLSDRWLGDLLVLVWNCTVICEFGVLNTGLLSLHLYRMENCLLNVRMQVGYTAWSSDIGNAFIFSVVRKALLLLVFMYSFVFSGQFPILFMLSLVVSLLLLYFFLKLLLLLL